MKAPPYTLNSVQGRGRPWTVISPEIGAGTVQSEAPSIDGFATITRVSLILLSVGTLIASSIAAANAGKASTISDKVLHHVKNSTIGSIDPMLAVASLTPTEETDAENAVDELGESASIAMAAHSIISRARLCDETLHITAPAMLSQGGCELNDQQAQSIANLEKDHGARLAVLAATSEDSPTDSTCSNPEVVVSLGIAHQVVNKDCDAYTNTLLYAASTLYKGSLTVNANEVQDVKNRFSSSTTSVSSGRRLFGRSRSCRRSCAYKSAPCYDKANCRSISLTCSTGWHFRTRWGGDYSYHLDWSCAIISIFGIRG